MALGKSFVCLFLVCVSVSFAFNLNWLSEEKDSQSADKKWIGSQDIVSRLNEECPANEHFDECTAHCQKDCDNKDDDITCTHDCHPGCICDEGLVRGPHGRCISPVKCSDVMKNVHEDLRLITQCPVNSEWTRCGANPECQKTCFNYDKTIPCDYSCVPGCICKEGYVLSAERRCIPIEECPRRSQQDSVLNQWPIPVICKKDEVFSLCVSTCPDDCDNYKDTGRKCNLICLPGCACKKGTLRGPDGKCIPKEQCPSGKKPEDCTEFEYYDTCGSSCPDNCTNHNIPAKDRQCDKRCVVDCFCKPGYVRGPERDCIFPYDCPTKQDRQQSVGFHIKQQSEDQDKPGRCPVGEHFQSCGLPESCQQNCANYIKPIPCTQPCVAGCVCDVGLIRESSPRGRCVRPEGCRRRSNEEMSKRNRQSESSEQNSISKSPMKVSKSKMWSQQESSEEVCPDYEIYDQCNAHPKCQANCTNYEKPIQCPVTCQPGCICEEGYVRESYPDGRCIKPRTCSKQNSQSESSEEWRQESNVRMIKSKMWPKQDRQSESSEKWLKEPQLKVKKTKQWPRHESSEEECPDNEVFDDCLAYPTCQRNCTNYDQDIKCPAICYKGCICETGYVREYFPDGPCVEKSTCPTRSMSSSDDWLSKSMESKMWPSQDEEEELNPEWKSISMKNAVHEPAHLPKIDMELRKSLIRSQKKDCPRGEVYDKCNAHPSCQRNCSYFETVIPCPAVCQPGCICEEGLVRETYPDGRCIRPQTCPKPSAHSWPSHDSSEDLRSDLFPTVIPPMPTLDCPDGEHFETCGVLDRCQRNCTTMDVDKEICPFVCVPGCMCDDGLVREATPKGRCIPRDQCPSPDTQSAEGPRIPGCPDEAVCSAECRRRSHRYGVCTGPRDRDCVCY